MSVNRKNRIFNKLQSCSDDISKYIITLSPKTLLNYKSDLIWAIKKIFKNNPAEIKNNINKVSARLSKFQESGELSKEQLVIFSTKFTELTKQINDMPKEFISMKDINLLWTMFLSPLSFNDVKVIRSGDIKIEYYEKNDKNIANITFEKDNKVTAFQIVGFNNTIKKLQDILFDDNLKKYIMRDTAYINNLYIKNHFKGEIGVGNFSYREIGVAMQEVKIIKEG